MKEAQVFLKGPCDLRMDKKTERRSLVVKIDTIIAIGAGFGMVIGPVQVGLARSFGSTNQQREVVSPDGEYQMKFLTEQVHELRDGLLTNERKVDQKTAAEWTNGIGNSITGMLPSALNNSAVWTNMPPYTMTGDVHRVTTKSCN